MRPVGFLTDPRCLEHLTGPTHPERPSRLRAITGRLAASGLAKDLLALEPRPAELEWLHAIHEPAYVEHVRRTCEGGGAVLDSMDTGVSRHSYEIALLAAGAGLAAADAVAAGKVQAAFAAIRPPGHHATRDTAMGFCLFNNAAIVSRYLQKAHGIGKVLVIDWDVHHGNGTQEAFWEDPSVFYFSIHQWPLYPGTGSAAEIGEGEGRGTTLNAPMPPGCGDDDYRRVFETRLVPALQAFAPGAVVISAGFDAHEADPLAGMRLTEAGFAALTKVVVDAAAPFCAGRVVSLLEGGYDLDALAASVEAHLGALLNR